MIWHALMCTFEAVWQPCVHLKLCGNPCVPYIQPCLRPFETLQSGWLPSALQQCSLVQDLDILLLCSRYLHMLLSTACDGTRVVAVLARH
jgi:hypothetical protein